jgi:hypothetical protein
MSPQARWMWFNASPGTITNPFNSDPGNGGHKEYLIFRLRTDPTGCIPAITVQPTNQVGCVGGTITLGVTTSSSTSLSYQWLKNGANVSGATGSSLVLSPLQASSAGSYSVGVSNACGSVTSTVVTVSVNTAPTITAQPATWTNCNGVWVTLNVGATGTGSLSYQWFKDGSSLPGATGTSLVIPAPGPGHSGQYWCVVTNGCGATETMHVAVVVVGAPTITTQPVNQSVCAGSAAQFAVAATSHASFPISSYRWFKSGVGFLSEGGAYSGTGTATLTISPVTSTEVGSYFVQLNNGCNFVNSNTRTLTLLASTAITAWPSDQDACEGSTVALAMTASGATPLSLQWKNPQGVVVSTTTTLSLSPVAESHAGVWRCIATGACPPTVEKTFTVTVHELEAPISIEYSRDMVCAGSRITLTANGGTGEIVRWYSGTCGSGLLGEGSPLTIPAPSDPTTIHARWESAVCGESRCASVFIPIEPQAEHTGFIVVLDRSAAMSVIRPATGNTRWEDALATARLDVENFTTQCADGLVAVWILHDGLVEDASIGFVGPAVALDLLYKLPPATPSGSAPLADALCAAYDKFASCFGTLDPTDGCVFPNPAGGSPIFYQRILSISSAGVEGGSSGACAGPPATSGVDCSSGFLPSDSWEQNVCNVSVGTTHVLLRHWNALQLVAGPGIGDHGPFFESLASATSNGIYQGVNDGAPGPTAFFSDCNGNGAWDGYDIASSARADENGNGLPDSCDAETGTTFCFGDGAQSACPCGNDSKPLYREGCLNSDSVGGRLRAIGESSVSLDTLALKVSRVPPKSYVIYFQGTDWVNGGAGELRGDGLKCYGGTVVRLNQRVDLSGSPQYPLVNDSPISVRGNCAASDRRFYQAMYRDADVFCTVYAFNLTNGVDITWAP